ncbi:MAG: o-succinylbenzoate--CoA ligase [Candidatus Binatia bacterium]
MLNDVVPNWLEQRAETSPRHVSLMYEGRAITFADLAARAVAVSRRLHCLGVGRGDRVALLVGNRPEFVEILNAAARLGAAVVPLNGRLSPAEIARQLDDSHPRLLLYDTAARDTAAIAREGLVLPAVSVDPDALSGDPVLDEIAADPDRGGTAIDLQATHCIVYTSGSSGRPKGVRLTFGNFLWSAVSSAFNLGVHRDDRWLACLPFCHVGGLSILLRSVIYGTTAVLHHGFDPARVDRALNEDRVTIISVVSNMLQRLLETRGERPFPPWLRCVLLGGGPAPPALLQACRARGLPVMQTYGLTEAASQVATLAPADAERKLGAAGKPLLGTEILLRGTDGSVPTGEVGEILIRGPSVSPGYLNPVGDAQHQDGWFCTGDLGRLDDEGFLYVMGRRDDMIISGGENVYPVEIEAVLQTHPAVAEACVFGVPDERWGTAVAACVRLRPGMTAGADDLTEHVRRHLAHFKAPRHMHFVDDFPRTAAGKIVRHRVQQSALPRVARRIRA